MTLQPDPFRRSWPSLIAAALPLVLVGCLDTAPIARPTDQTARPLRVSAVHGCQRADICTVSLAQSPAQTPAPRRGHIEIQIAGIEVPDHESRCKRERMLAREAQRVTEALLSKGTSIQITDVSRDEGLRMVGRLVVDGEDVGSQLLERQLAVAHGGRGTARWCTAVN